MKALETEKKLKKNKKVKNNWVLFKNHWMKAMEATKVSTQTERQQIVQFS